MDEYEPVRHSELLDKLIEFKEQTRKQDELMILTLIKPEIDILREELKNDFL
jgi:hypothetical protein